MGYVFDALNQAGDDADHEATPPQAAATPGVPETFTEIEAAEALGEPTQPTPEPIRLDPAQIARLDDRLVGLTHPGAIMAEEYRAIRTSILARWEQKRHLVHTITSATPQEGKTITSLNLGLSFSELRNRQTIVIEADLRLPTFAKLMPVHEGPGLIALLRGEASLDRVIQRFADRNLSVIPAGGRSNSDAVQLLSSPVAAELLTRLRQRYDHVIIDTPPVIELADAGILGAQSDEVLLVARMQRTPRTLVEQAVRTLGSYNAPVAGLIATDHKRLRRRYYSYRYGYRYAYHDGKHAA